jgi:hypothetical protein
MWWYVVDFKFVTFEFKLISVDGQALRHDVLS